MHPLAIMTPDGWRPGIGDPDFLGWTITLTYFLVAGLCAWAWRGESALGWRSRHAVRPGVWVALAALLVFLGCNKQLDLQQLVVATAKDAVRALGLWDLRRPIGFGLVGAGAVAGAAGMYALYRYVGRTRPRYQMAFVGLAYLGTFVVARAGSFLPVLGKINRRHLEGMHLVLELGALIIIGVCAARALGFVTERLRAARQDAMAQQGGFLVIGPMPDAVARPEAVPARRAA